MLRQMFFGAALVVTPFLADAHIAFAEPQAPAGTYYAGFLRVTHGCGSSPTVSIRVEIPAAIDSARPQPKAGWTLSTKRVALAKPITSEGGSVIRDRVSTITWSGILPADEFDQFGIMLKLPAGPGPLYFPTVQRCADGSNDWINVPVSPDGWHATKMPAPMLIVSDKPAEDPMAHMSH